MTEKKKAGQDSADANTDLLEEIRDLSEKGRISCRAAFGLAERRGLSVAEVGRTIDRMEIKIVACQLGCFK